MKNQSAIRIAWLVPAVELGAYWQPVLREFTKIFPKTKFYTGHLWSNFDRSLPGAYAFELVGETKFVKTEKIETGYDRGFFCGFSEDHWLFIKISTPGSLPASLFSLDGFSHFVKTYFPLESRNYL